MFRVNFIPNLGISGAFTGKPCETKNQAIAQLNIIADYTLFLCDDSLMDDHANYGFIEQEIDGIWVEIDDDV